MQLNNPRFIQLLKLGKEARWCPSTVTIPTLTSAYIPASSSTSIDLRPEQKVVFDEMVDSSTCLLEAMTSFGKTVMAIALHQAWGGRTLVVAHSLVLAQQFHDEFVKFTGIKPTLFCGGKHDMSGEVVITTHTTFRQKYDRFADFNNLIVDEADLMFTDKALVAISESNITRKHGFTGTTRTPYDDCNTIEGGVLAAFWGKHVRGEFDESKNPLKGVFYKTYRHTYRKDGFIIAPKDWITFRGELDDDIERKKAQIEYIQETTDGVEPTLVLFDRVADVEAFYNAMNKRGMTAYMVTGQLIKRKRDEMLDGFHKTGGYLVAQTTTMNRGYSNTELTKCFIMYPVKGENVIRQIIGRLMRYFTGKEAFLYLWSDSALAFQFKKQKEIINRYFGIPIEEI